MISVIFPDTVDIADELLKFAVIVVRNGENWVFCRHKKRDTWEIPGGHREVGENIFATAKRELFEETGAYKPQIEPIGVYGVEKDGVTTYGMLFYADVQEFMPLPSDSEIGEICFSPCLPNALTYPAIQPRLFEKTNKWLRKRSLT